MTLDRLLTSTLAQRIALLLLRVTTGFLLIWGGLNKIVKAKPPMAIGRNFELDATTNAILGYATGGAQLVIGVLCVVGLWRRFALPLQAVIHGFTAVSVWWAIIDPYRWYITGVDRIVFNSQVFYPTSITFAACLLLIVFRHQDVFALDHLRRDALAIKPEAQPEA
ncbi:MAG: putative oxidoreductase [Paracoccaceae bacterium]|jgi:putative oxidoreductase